MSTAKEKTIHYAKLTGQTLTEWRERMGYSKTDASDALGCSRTAWRGWEEGTQDIPRYIGLACAALALGMKPYGALTESDR
jgi:predicted transcriptional regulator